MERYLTVKKQHAKHVFLYIEPCDKRDKIMTSGPKKRLFTQVWPLAK